MYTLYIIYIIGITYIYIYPGCPGKSCIVYFCLCKKHKFLRVEETID